ncbi:MAG: carbonic anhydrase [Candidatus Micrarchaeia archaeon]
MASKNIAELLEGNKIFQNSNKDFKDLLKGQNPSFVIVACSDSRVTPSILLNSKLGEIFEIRTAGNTIGDIETGSIEYAVEHLGTKNIMILAHTNCGAVREAQKLFDIKIRKEIESKKEQTSLEKLALGIYQNISRDSSNREDDTKAAIDNAFVQKEELKKSEIIKRHLENGSLKLYIGLYDMASGNIEIINEEGKP